MKDYNQTYRLAFTLACLGECKDIDELICLTGESREICKNIKETIHESVMIAELNGWKIPESFEQAQNGFKGAYKARQR